MNGGRNCHNEEKSFPRAFNEKAAKRVCGAVQDRKKEVKKSIKLFF